MRDGNAAKHLENGKQNTLKKRKKNNTNFQRNVLSFLNFRGGLYVCFLNFKTVIHYHS